MSSYEKNLYDWRNECIENDISNIVRWLYRKYSTIVVFSIDEEDSLDEDDNIIYINTRKNKIFKLNILLHEAGHVIIYNTPDYDKRYVKNKRDINSRIDTVRLEVEAWEQGLKLAKKLSISINEKKYYYHMRNCLKSYIDWCYESKRTFWRVVK